jgi:hypothetical protein
MTMSELEPDDLDVTGWHVAAPPPQIVDRILARVAAHADREAVPAVGPVEPPPVKRGRATRVLAVAALVAAAAVVIVFARPSDERVAPRPAAPSSTEPAAQEQPTPLWPTPPVRTPQAAPRLLTTPAEHQAYQAAIEAAWRARWRRITTEPGREHLPLRGRIWASREDAEKVVELAAPFLDACFARASTAAQQQGGSITARLVVLSEPTAGTLIVRVNFEGGGLAEDPPFRDCVGLTLTNLALPATPTGQPTTGGWGMTHTFEFARGPGDKQPHARPPSPVMFEPVPTADDLAAHAMRAIAAGDYTDARDFAAMATEIDPWSAAAFEAGALASCMRHGAGERLLTVGSARAYAELLQGHARTRVRVACAGAGVSVR